MTPSDATQNTRPQPRTRAAGTLGTTLLRHAVDLAREKGVAGLTLRDVQRRAGVSHNAAYRHFADRTALLARVGAEAAGILGARMHEAVEAVGPAGSSATTSRLRLAAAGRAYVAFALAEPGLFSALGCIKDLMSDGDPDCAEMAVAPLAVLSALLDELVAGGELSATRRKGADIAAWSAVHGLAVLILEGPLAALGETERTAATERTLALVVDGLTAGGIDGCSS